MRDVPPPSPGACLLLAFRLTLRPMNPLYPAMIARHLPRPPLLAHMGG